LTEKRTKADGGGGKILTKDGVGSKKKIKVVSVKKWFMGGETLAGWRRGSRYNG